MAVNRKVHDSLAVGVTNASAQSLLAQVRQMLIDQGVMTDWYDTWTLANNRNGNNYYGVLQLVQDAGKAYGTSYIIFCGSCEPYDARTRLSISFACGAWNATSHICTGTQYLDYYGTPGTDTWYIYNGNARTVFEIYNTYRDIRLVSYKSGNTVVFHYPSLTGAYVLQSAIDTQPSWVDLSKAAVIPFFCLGGSSGNYGNGYRCLYWYWPFVLRRMVFPGRTATGTAIGYFNTRLISMTYMYSGFGVEPNLWADVLDPSSADYTNPLWGGAIRLPWSDGANLPIAGSAWAPTVTGVDMALPLNLKLPSDFCIATLASQSRAGSALDRVTVSANEVWEIVALQATSWAPNSMVLMARIT